jgi:archaemetzincin
MPFLSFMSPRVRAALAGATLLVGGIRPALGAAPAPTEEARPPLVVVRPLGTVDAADLRAACRALLGKFPVRCVVGARRSLVELAPAWNAPRGQLDARAALEELFRTRSADALVELHVTSVDLFEPGKPYVFGLASLTDRVGLISLARIGHDGEEASAPTRRLRRFQKLVLHETGHAMGLPHHDRSDCVMRQDATPESLDHAPDAPCTACRARLDEQALRLSRPGQQVLDRVRGHLVRGELELARSRLVQSLASLPRDAALLAHLGTAFLEARQWNEAISLLDLALKLDPSLAEAHANRGVALQMRGRNGDVAVAIHHLTRALELRPDWGSVEARLEALHQERARAQGPGRD